MSNGTSNNHKLKDRPPYAGDHKVAVNLKMYYSIAEDYYIFLYRGTYVTKEKGLIDVDPELPDTPTEFGRIKLKFDSEGKATVVEKYFQDLNIGIMKDYKKVLITVETVDNGNFKDMYWHQDLDSSPEIEAIMTRENRKEHYGHLLYSVDGLRWSDTIPTEPCRFIQFKAKEKPGKQENHKFSYNVRLPGIIDFLEVDPEIQNPKV